MVKFLRVGPEDQRWRFLKSREELEDLPPESEEVFVEGILEHYAMRKVATPAVANMSLIVFAAFYDLMNARSVPSATENDEGQKDDMEVFADAALMEEVAKEAEPDAQDNIFHLNDADFPPTISILNKKDKEVKRYRKRRRRAIIRYARPSPDEHIEDYAYTMLQLFFPHGKDGISLTNGQYTSYTEWLIDVQPLIATAVAQFEFYSDLIGDVFEQMSKQQQQAADARVGQIGAIVAGEGQDDQVDRDPGEDLEAIFRAPDEDENAAGQNSNQPAVEESIVAQPPPSTDAKDLQEKLNWYKSNFNDDQRNAFLQAVKLIQNFKKDQANYRPYTGKHQFISGPGVTTTLRASLVALV